MKNSNDRAALTLTDEEREKRLLSTAGLAARARNAVMGTDQVCESIRQGQVRFVLEASDASENTKKRLFDKTAYYGIPLCRLKADCEALAQAFGKRNGSIAAVGITDDGIIQAMKKYLPKESKDSDGERI